MDGPLDQPRREKETLLLLFLTVLLDTAATKRYVRLATPPNSEIIYVQNVGAKVEMVSYLKK